MLSLFIRHLHFCNKKCPIEKQSVLKLLFSIRHLFIFNLKFQGQLLLNFMVIFYYCDVSMSNSNMDEIQENKSYCGLNYLMAIKRKGWDTGSQPISTTTDFLTYAIFGFFIILLNHFSCMERSSLLIIFIHLFVNLYSSSSSNIQYNCVAVQSMASRQRLP